jgi:hypothetical protein
MIKYIAILVWLALALVAFPAGAADPTAAEKETARALLLDGRAKLAAGDGEGALKAFQGAHALMGVPTTGLDLARGLAAVGRLIEARAAALDVVRIPVKPGEPQAFADARAAAGQLAEAIGTRIPAVVVTVKGGEGAAVAVTLDGAALQAALLGLSRKVDPGVHVVTASAPGLVAEAQRVTVKDGETVRVEVVLRPVGAVVVAPVRVPVPRAVGEKQRTVPVARVEAPVPASAQASRRVPVWAWVTGGAGLAALGGGVAFAVDYASLRSTLAKACPGMTCPPGTQTEATVQALRGRWNHDLGLALGLGGAGLAGVGAAIGGIVKAPGAARRVAQTVLAPWVAPGAAGAVVGGEF